MSLKQQILKGAKHTAELHVPELETDDFDGVVTVRALTDAEEGEAEESEVAGQIVRGQHGKRPNEIEVNVGTSAAGQLAGRRIRAAYGLSVNGEKWTTEDVAQLPPKAVQRIAKKAEELTGGGGLAEEARQFRGDRPGPDDRDPAPDRDAAGSDAG